MAEHQTYDVIVVGSGTAGSIIASRIAEKGINPRTGDRLRVAMIEGGPYYIPGKEKPRPGYGAESRRKVILNINFLEYRPKTWPYDGHQNRMVGGCGLHWGGNAWLPFPEQYDLWRRASGVDWTEEGFKEAVEEVTDTYNVKPAILENMVLGNNLFRDAAKSMGYNPTLVPMARKNCINSGYCGSGHVCKYDAKGSSLFYIHLAEENGVEIIPDAEVDQIIIEKKGAAAEVTGVNYTQNGQKKEARAPKVIVACGTNGTPVVLMRSGYGPRSILGNKVIVENENVGKHLDGDINHNVEAFFDQDIKGTRGGVERYQFTKTNAEGKLGENNVHYFDTGMPAVDEGYPQVVALHRWAPEFGMDHKNFMRTANKRLGAIAVRLRSPIWETGSVDPTGKFDYPRDNPNVLKILKDGTELVVELYGKMSLRPIKLDPKPPERFRIGHEVGSCRAGESAKNSVVNSDFESHDVKNLFISSAAVIPRGTLSHSHMPTVVVAAYMWRRLVKNHFSRGA